MGQLALCQVLKDIEDIKSDKLLITDSTDNVDQEIENNCWSISINDELSNEFSADELASFLKEVKTDRREQLRESLTGCIPGKLLLSIARFRLTR